MTVTAPTDELDPPPSTLTEAPVRPPRTRRAVPVALALTAARLGNRWGRRRVFRGGIALFTLASIGSALATSAGALIPARAVQGVGGAANGYAPLEAGTRTLPWTAAPMVVAPIAGLLAPRVGIRVLLGTGLALQAIGLILARTHCGRVHAVPRPHARLRAGRRRDGADLRAERDGGACRLGTAVLAAGAIATRWLPRTTGRG